MCVVCAFLFSVVLGCVEEKRERERAPFLPSLEQENEDADDQDEDEEEEERERESHTDGLKKQRREGGREGGREKRHTREQEQQQ